MAAHDCGERVDASFRALAGAQRGAIIEITPAIPRAIPGLGIDDACQICGLGAAVGRLDFAGSQFEQFCKVVEDANHNHASQTLSPLPPTPTRLSPSFQSPPPISGSPCGPRLTADDGAPAMLE
jgi:hypothetical protein